MSLALRLLELVVPMDGPLTDEPVLELAFAVILPSIGAAILFNIDSSTGGTDIIAMLLKKYTSIDIGRSLLRPICDYILNQLHRSATVLDAKGAFSDKDKKIILTVMSRAQAVNLRKFIHNTEPEAFLLITNTSEIIGRGFRG